MRPARRSTSKREPRSSLWLCRIARQTAKACECRAVRWWRNPRDPRFLVIEAMVEAVSTRLPVVLEAFLPVFIEWTVTSTGMPQPALAPPRESKITPHQYDVDPRRLAPLLGARLLLSGRWDCLFLWTAADCHAQSLLDETAMTSGPLVQCPHCHNHFTPHMVWVSVLPTGEAVRYGQLPAHSPWGELCLWSNLIVTTV